MTERLADITARIGHIGQLGSAVNAVRGLAGARAQVARGQLAAVEGYTAIIEAAIARSFALLREPLPPPPARKSAQVLFCAEQGFAGAFSEHVLDHADPGATLFLIGIRGAALAAERGLAPAWRCAFPAASADVPGLAGRIAAALYGAIARGGIGTVEALYCRWLPAAKLQLQRRRLLPIGPADFPAAAPGTAPLLTLPAVALLEGLTADHVHAVLCQAALHSFVAENEARVAMMAAAHRHIEAQLQTLEQTRRVVRQEEITAEIIELADRV